MTSEQLETIEAVVAAVLGGDDTRYAQLFRVCCYNSKRKPSQLTPRWILALPGFAEASHSEFSRLRKKVNAFAESPGARRLPMRIRFEDKPRYVVTFIANKDGSDHHGPALAKAKSPVRADRFVTLDELLALERADSDGGHLLKHANLIIQGDAPFILKPAIAEIAVDNMSKGIGYQFVFSHDQPADTAAVLVSLLQAPVAGTSIGAAVAANIKRIGDRLEIWLSDHLWPFVISVHNAGDEAAAKSYIIVEDTNPEVLFLLARGVRAQQIAKKIRNLVLQDDALPSADGWMQSPVAPWFRKDLMKELVRRLHLAADSKTVVRLEARLFGTPSKKMRVGRS